MARYLNLIKYTDYEIVCYPTRCMYLSNKNTNDYHITD